jgi:hypothetical protein
VGPLTLSKHASTRLQQRGIAPLVIDLLLKFGTTEKSGRDTTKYYFDKPARRRLRRLRAYDRTPRKPILITTLSSAQTARSSPPRRALPALNTEILNS